MNGIIEIESRSSPTKWLCLASTKLDISDHKIKKPYYNGDKARKCESCDTIHITHSDITNKSKEIPGILVLEKNKTFGRVSNNSLKRYYKFFPYESKYPIFYIPYLVKSAFCKKQVNRYVVIKFDHYNHKTGISYGKIHQTIGNVNKDENIYTYMLYCNDIVYKRNKINGFFASSIKLHGFDNILKQLTPFLEDRRTTKTQKDGLKYKIISVDPVGCLDIDDACSLTTINGQSVLSIYISNVTLVLNILRAWDVLKENLKQTATIYLPTNKLSMLPSILSDNICSLVENEDRVALAMDIFFHSNQETIEKIEFKNVLIKVSDNLSYEEAEKHIEYKRIEKVVRNMNENIKPLVYDFRDSHSTVEYLMLYMNIKVSEKMNNGIFRISEEVGKPITNDVIQQLPVNISKFIDIYRKYNSYYSTKEIQHKNGKTLEHVILEVDSYLQITSPIRRLGDVVNQALFIHKYVDKTVLSESSFDFIRHVTSEEYIHHLNAFHKKVRKVQNNARLLHYLKHNEEATTKTYEAYFINNEGVVYIPKLNIIKSTTVKKSNQFERVNVQIYLFYDEANIHRKWRVTVV